MSDFAPLAVAAALVWKLITTLKAVTAQDWTTAKTQAFVWVAGIAVAFLLAASDFAGAVPVGDTTLAGLNTASLVLFGTALGSVASVGYDVKRSIDNGDSAVEPKLGGSPTP